MSQVVLHHLLDDVVDGRPAGGPFQILGLDRFDRSCVQVHVEGNTPDDVTFGDDTDHGVDGSDRNHSHLGGLQQDRGVAQRRGWLDQRDRVTDEQVDR